MLPDALVTLASAQDQVVSRAQLRAVGITRSSLRQHIRARRWALLGTRVVVLHTGPCSTRQRWWAGVLHAGDNAGLAGRSAAQSHGLTRMDDGQIHVLVPHGSRIPRLPGFRFHETRRRPLLHTPGLPARQPLAAALVSAATWSARRDVAAGLLATGVQQRRVEPSELARAVKAAGAVRHAPLMRAVIGDLAGGAESFAEIDGARLARLAGLPPPRRQSYRLVNGRRRYLDLDFGGWVAEIDGAVHLLPERHAADLLRHDDLILAGDRVLHFSALTVRLQPQQVVQRMRQADMRWGNHELAEDTGHPRRVSSANRGGGG
jgi:hypothetical protein